MPVSKKRKVETKPEEKSRFSNIGETKAGKILILILAASMVVGLLVAAIVLVVQYLG